VGNPNAESLLVEHQRECQTNIQKKATEGSRTSFISINNYHPPIKKKMKKYFGVRNKIKALIVTAGSVCLCIATISSLVVVISKEKEKMLE
jgi:hypothetical protein